MAWITFQMKEGLQIDGKVYQSGDIFSLILNRFETYQIAHTVDMTGTVVESSSPIAVFSGNDCNILNGQGFCDHLIEQLPPTSRRGSHINVWSTLILLLLFQATNHVILNQMNRYW